MCRRQQGSALLLEIRSVTLCITLLSFEVGTFVNFGHVVSSIFFFFFTGIFPSIFADWQKYCWGRVVW